ncbi:MAG: vWA domain-containing protein [Pseudomonadota bacterium]
MWHRRSEDNAACTQAVGRKQTGHATRAVSLALLAAAICLTLPANSNDRHGAQAGHPQIAVDTGHPRQYPSAAADDLGGHDVALLIDVSRSMAGDRLDAMRQATADLLAHLFNGTDQRPGLRVAVVPFSARVNAGHWLRDAGWAPPHEDLACVEEPNPNPLTLTRQPLNVAWTPSRDLPLTGWRQLGKDWVFGEVRADAPCPEPLLGLQASRALAVNKLAELEAAGTARPDLALHWGWRVLSPDWNGKATNPVHRQTGAASKRRTMVMITDGELAPSYSRTTRRDAEAQFAEACVAAGDASIDIVMVAFMAKAQHETHLRRCATGTENFFTAHSINGLQTLMGAVASAILGDTGPTITTAAR